MTDPITIRTFAIELHKLATTPVMYNHFHGGRWHCSLVDADRPGVRGHGADADPQAAQVEAVADYQRQLAAVMSEEWERAEAVQ